MTDPEGGVGRGQISKTGGAYYARRFVGHNNRSMPGKAKHDINLQKPRPLTKPLIGTIRDSKLTSNGLVMFFSI